MAGRVKAKATPSAKTPSAKAAATAGPKPRPTKPTGPAKPPATAKPTGWRPQGAATLERVLADRKVTDAEWRTVSKELGSTLGAPQHRQLLEAYLDGRVGFEPGASEGARETLATKGFDVPGRRDDGSGRLVPAAVELTRVLEGTVTEADVTFDALQALVGSSGSLRLAVVDGGFAAHPVLSDNLDGAAKRAKAGADIGKRLGHFTSLEKEHGARHGTHVAGIATRGTSSIQASLFAVPLEVPDDPEAVQRPAGSNPLPDALEAAAKSGASVINVSIEAFGDRDELARYRRVMERFPQALFVFGAGNDGYELGSSSEGDLSVVESFKLPNLVVVGASLPDGGRWGQSNVSARWVDVAARGHAIASTSNDGVGLRTESGTSMASPNVANLVAKCRLLHPALEPAMVVKLLQATSDEHWSWKGHVASGGTVNAERAMRGAAVLALVARGAPLESAVERLGLADEERARLTGALRQLAAS